MASIQYVVGATDNMSRVLEKISLSAGGLDRQLADLSRRVATPEVDLKDAKFTLGMVNAAKRLDKLSAMVTDPSVEVDAAKAQTEILRISAQLDRLDKKHVTATVTVRQRFDKAAGAGFLQPSPMGAGIALSPALIPLAAGIAAGIGAIGISLGAAGIGATGFGLLAKSALTTAGTAATAVKKAQQTYNAAIATGTKHATAYAAEQKAIRLAYAGMSPAQIALSKQVGDLGGAWDKVQRSVTPVISGALVPWLDAVTKGMQLIKPFVVPIAAVFKSWGDTLRADFASPAAFDSLRSAAAAFGKFSAAQLRDIGTGVAGIATGFFSLGKDLVASGANLGAAGGWLAHIGTGFATWSKSAQARADVQSFLRYLHSNGAIVKGILTDLGKVLPGILKGASVTGQLELQAIAGFLQAIASLPKGWQAPLTEAAGALLLLSKTGVLKVGLKLTGKLAEHPTAFGFTIGTLLAAGIIDAVNQKRPGHGQQTWWQSFGPPAKDQQQTWLNSWSGLGDRIVQIADDVRHGVAVAWELLWNNTVGRTIRGGHDVEAALDPLRHRIAIWGHDIASAFDVFRHAQGQFDAFGHDVSAVSRAITSAFDAMRHGTAIAFDAVRHVIASTWDRIFHDTIAKLGSLRHGVATVFDAVRHGIAAAWDSIWSHSNIQAQGGIDGIVHWFKTLPGRVASALAGLGHQLYATGHSALTSFLSGLKSVAGSVFSWVGNFVSSIWNKVKNFFGVKSPSALFYGLGKNLMLGLFHGIRDHAHTAADAARAVSQRVADAGAGVQRWAPLVRRALAMEGLSPSLLGNVLFQMQTESGGNPNAINLGDINARMGDPSRGLMQTIMSTFQAYHWPGTSGNIYDPFANIAAALNYGRHVYGPSLMSGGMGIGSGHGYAMGSWNVPHTGPAVVHQGEMIIPAGSAAAIRSGGRGPLVHIDNFNSYDATDPLLLSQRISFAITAAGLGS